MYVKKLLIVGITLVAIAIVMASVVATLVEAAPDRISEWKVISEAYSWLGVPYKYGGEPKNGVDCSALVRQVYMRAGGRPATCYDLMRGWHACCEKGTGACYKDRTAEEIRQVSKPVWPPRPGDVVIFIDKTTGKATHVGIYIGPSNYGYWDAYFISAIYRIGGDSPMKVELDRLYFSKHGTGIWYKYFYIYFARYNPDGWTA